MKSFLLFYYFTQIIDFFPNYSNRFPLRTLGKECDASPAERREFLMDLKFRRVIEYALICQKITIRERVFHDRMTNDRHQARCNGLFLVFIPYGERAGGLILVHFLIILLDEEIY